MAAFKNSSEIVSLIEQATHIVALTGAGLSTAAGIPDFRGPQGIYVTRQYDPEKTFDIRWFKRDPKYFYQFAFDFIELLTRIRPTFAHTFLARLEGAGKLSAVISQNIDMLHQAAGNSHVIELHGSLVSATCCDCSKNYSPLNVTWWQKAMATNPRTRVAICQSCGGVMKPDIVFYGEQVHRYSEAEEAVKECDLLLVLGTSLTVYPAAFLPDATTAPIIAVSQGTVALTPANHHYIVKADLDEICRNITEHLTL
jgi:NAD-dependent deacetylase